MTVEELRKAAEDAKFSAYIARRGDNEVSIMRAIEAADRLHTALTPERVLALTKGVEAIAAYCSSTLQTGQMCEALAGIEAAFGESND